MDELSTLNGYEIVDKKARGDILELQNGGGGGGSIDTSSLLPFPLDSEGNIDYGQPGQMLISNADGTTSWVDATSGIGKFAYGR